MTPPPSNGVYEQLLAASDVAEILDVGSGVPGDRCQHLQPFSLRIEPIDLKEGLISVWCGCDQRRLRRDDSVSRDPIKRIAPAVFLELAAPRFLELLQEVNGPAEGMPAHRSPRRGKRSPSRSARPRWEIGLDGGKAGARRAGRLRTGSSARPPRFRRPCCDSRGLWRHRRCVRQRTTGGPTTSRRTRRAIGQNSSSRRTLDPPAGRRCWRPVAILLVVSEKLSTFFIRNIERKIALSFFICSRRWNRISSLLTGRSTRRRAAHEYPKKRASPPVTPVFCHSVRDAEQLPNGRAAEIVVLFPVREQRCQLASFGRPHRSVMMISLFGETSALSSRAFARSSPRSSQPRRPGWRHSRQCPENTR